MERKLEEDNLVRVFSTIKGKKGIYFSYTSCCWKRKRSGRGLFDSYTKTTENIKGTILYINVYNILNSLNR